ncbi:MAG: M67 family metallopeptidase, partial [Acidobacteriota bacterium]
MKIHRERLEEIIEHAWRDSPRECCGLLVGPVEGAEEVERVVPCENSLQSPRAFSIPPRQLFELFRQIRTEGRSLVGIYHSHPTTEAVPSERDVKEFYYPG